MTNFKVGLNGKVQVQVLVHVHCSYSALTALVMYNLQPNFKVEVVGFGFCKKNGLKTANYPLWW